MNRGLRSGLRACAAHSDNQLMELQLLAWLRDRDITPHMPVLGGSIPRPDDVLPPSTSLTTAPRGLYCPTGPVFGNPGTLHDGAGQEILVRAPHTAV